MRTSRGELLINRQGDVVDEVLDVGQGVRVEGRDPAGEAADEVFELGI